MLTTAFGDGVIEQDQLSSESSACRGGRALQLAVYSSMSLRTREIG